MTFVKIILSTKISIYLLDDKLRSMIVYTEGRVYVLIVLLYDGGWLLFKIGLLKNFTT